VRTAVKWNDKISVAHGCDQHGRLVAALNGGLTLDALQFGEEVRLELRQPSRALLASASFRQLALLAVHLQAQAPKDKTGRRQNQQEQHGLPFGNTVLDSWRQ